MSLQHIQLLPFSPRNGIIQCSHRAHLYYRFVENIGAKQRSEFFGFWNIATLPLRRIGPGLVFAVTVYVVGYNVGVRWWKGPDHPVNMFTWQRMEGEGLLSEELLQKKKTVMDYYTSRFFGEWTDSFSTSDSV
ncbi:hypothetical protein NECAME_16131 [Necator americanus]|uniref:Uncharacterized protein n=1 Tax=Necator americanus TaxID=51031 RepID=W2U0H3_NECAM|nr:hypothetical protein NECAME_16131 [Necator americanus]ETN86787.1 hypothetical protein NECAME_16131 [Necator americanus]